MTLTMKSELYQQDEKIKNMELVMCLRRIRKNSPSLANVNINFLGGDTVEDSDATTNNNNNGGVFMKTETATTSIYISQKKIGRMSVKAILRTLANNPIVQKIGFSYLPSSVCGEAEDILMDTLHESSHLLCLEILDIKSDGMMALSSVLQKCTTTYCNNSNSSNICALREIYLTSESSPSISTTTSQEAADRLMQTLVYHPSIRALRFKGVNQVILQAIASSIQEMSNKATLAHLCLDSCMSDPQVAATVLSSLRHNSSLKHVEILHSTIGQAGARALSSSVAQNQSLQSLVLRDCRLGGNIEIAKHLASMIQHNTSLHEINLEQNWIGTEETILIANALHINRSLVKLHYRGNFPLVGGVTSLADALQDNASLQFIDIGGMWENQVAFSSSCLTPGGYEELFYGLELNRAGRGKVRDPNFAKPDFVELLEHSKDQTHLLYGLLRELPHQWSNSY